MVAAVQLRTSPALRDDDLLPQVVSWVVAAAIGAAWLLIVYLSPDAVAPKPPATPVPPSVIFESGLGPAAQHPTAINSSQSAARGTHPRASTSRSVINAAGLFTAAATAGIVEHLEQFIPGVIGVTGDVGTRAAAGKSALSADGTDTRPGMARMNGSHGAATGSASLGQVQGGSSIAHVGVHVRQLPIVQAAPLGAETADATEMGSFVRGRVAQLQTCYERVGGTDLAGVVALRLTIGVGGAVQSANVARRSWSGPGAAATEGCLLDMVKAWHIPFAAEGTTVTIPISFTRGG